MGVFAPSLQIVQKSGEGLLLQEKRSGLCLSFPSHCKGNSWWEGTHRAVLGRREAVTPPPPVKWLKDLEGQFVLAGKLLFLLPGTLQSARKETGLKQQEKKRNFPGISKGFPTLGKNGNSGCVP